MSRGCPSHGTYLGYVRKDQTLRNSLVTPFGDRGGGHSTWRSKNMQTTLRNLGICFGFMASPKIRRGQKGRSSKYFRQTNMNELHNHGEERILRRYKKTIQKCSLRLVFLKHPARFSASACGLKVSYSLSTKRVAKYDVYRTRCCRVFKLIKFHSPSPIILLFSLLPVRSN